MCLYYSTQEEKWLPHVPKQHGSAAFVEYDDEQWEAPKGYYFTGTIHTHPNIAARWSTIDTADQIKHNGLHVVLSLREGKLDDYLVSLSYHGKLYPQEKDLVEMPELDKLPEAREDWLEQVKEEFIKATSKEVYKVSEKSALPETEEEVLEDEDCEDDREDDSDVDVLDEFDGLDFLAQNVCGALMDSCSEDELSILIRFMIREMQDASAVADVLKKGLKNMLSALAIAEPQYLYSIAQQALEVAEEPALAEQVGAACYQAESDSADVW